MRILRLLDALLEEVRAIRRALELADHDPGPAPGRSAKSRPARRRGPKPLNDDELQPTEMDVARAKRALRRKGLREL